MTEEKLTEIKDEKYEFGTKDLAAIILLIFVFPIGLIFMWFVVKWPKWIKIILTIPVLLAIIGTILGVFIINALTNSPEELPIIEEGQIVCTQEVKLCPDGETYVGREAPTCEFAQCPIAEPGDTTPPSEIEEFPDTSTTTPTEETEELFPTAPAEQE